MQRGAMVGKMISPQSIAIASSATDLTNNEGKLLGNGYYSTRFQRVYKIIVHLFNKQEGG